MFIVTCLPCLVGSEPVSPFCGCLFILPVHMSLLWFHVTHCLITHIIRLPIASFGFRLSSYLVAGPHDLCPPRVYNTNLLINTNRCKLGFHTNVLMFFLAHLSITLCLNCAISWVFLFWFPLSFHLVITSAFSPAFIFTPAHVSVYLLRCIPVQVLSRLLLCHCYPVYSISLPSCSSFPIIPKSHLNPIVCSLSTVYIQTSFSVCQWFSKASDPQEIYLRPFSARLHSAFLDFFASLFLCLTSTNV